MTDHKQLDAQDLAALHKLDEDFTVNPNGTAGTVSGLMTIEIARHAPEGGDRWLMTIHFPSGESFDAQFLRTKVLEQIGVKADESKPNG